MTITELQDKISEYENKLAKIFEANGYSLMINHSILENDTGTIACWGICTIADKKDIAYASVIQTTHTRLAFIDKIKSPE